MVVPTQKCKIFNVVPTKNANSCNAIVAKIWQKRFCHHLITLNVLLPLRACMRLETALRKNSDYKDNSPPRFSKFCSIFFRKTVLYAEKVPFPAGIRPRSPKERSLRQASFSDTDGTVTCSDKKAGGFTASGFPSINPNKTIKENP